MPTCEGCLRVAAAILSFSHSWISSRVFMIWQILPPP
jgi:hypothetical protein